MKHQVSINEKETLYKTFLKDKMKNFLKVKTKQLKKNIKKYIT